MKTPFDILLGNSNVCGLKILETYYEEIYNNFEYIEKICTTSVSNIENAWGGDMWLVSFRKSTPKTTWWSHKKFNRQQIQRDLMSSLRWVENVL